MMFKKTIIILAAIGAAMLSAPADAGHRDRGRAQIVVSVGSPGYYGNPYGGYRSSYRDPYYRPHRYEERPRYYYRQRQYYDDRYYRPHKRHWKKRNWRRHHGHY